MLRPQSIACASNPGATRAIVALALGFVSFGEQTLAAPATAAAAAAARSTDETQTDATPQAVDAEAEFVPAPADASPPLWTEYAPAPTDAPQLRNVAPVTRVYVDGGYAETPDLSALPFVIGSGKNYRASVGGSLRWGRFQFDTELPSAQSTSLFLVAVPGGEPMPGDERQTSRAIGDWRLGAQWTDFLPVDAFPLMAGFSLRARIPTHTTRFQFQLVNGDLGVYRFPYYVHVEPAVLLGGALGRLSFVMNQGALAMVGPGGDFGGFRFNLPALFFWDAHYALAFRLADFLSVSTEIATTFQVNRVADINFQKVNDLRSVVIAPAIHFRLPGGVGVDLVGRWGLTPDADLFGVLSYAGSRSLTLRVSLLF